MDNGTGDIAHPHKMCGLWSDLLAGKLALSCSDQLSLKCLDLGLSGFKKPSDLQLMGQ